MGMESSRNNHEQSGQHGYVPPLHPHQSGNNGSQGEITVPGSGDTPADTYSHLPERRSERMDFPVTVSDIRRESHAIVRDLRDKANPTDWKGVVDGYFDNGLASDVAPERPYANLKQVITQFRTTSQAPSDLETARAGHAELVSFTREVAERGDVRPDAENWQRPESWTPNEPSPENTWASTMVALGKYMGPARRQFVEQSTDLAMSREAHALEKLAWRTDDADSPSILVVPLPLAHALHLRGQEAYSHYYVADNENLAAVAAALPESAAVEDPHDVAARLGIDDPLTWLSEKLEMVPDHIKQGLGTVCFEEYPEEYPEDPTDGSVRPRVVYDTERNRTTVHVHADRLHEHALHNPADTDRVRDEYDTALTIGLARAAFRHDLSNHLSAHALTEWMGAWTKDVRMGGPTAAGGNNITDEGVDMIDADVQDYALIGVQFLFRPETLENHPGFRHRYGFMEYRAMGWGGLNL